jgi:predicted permease
MENFIYSINVTFPIFLVMVIGYFLKQIGMLNDNFVTVANRFNFKVTLPFMLFRDIAGVDIRAVFDLKYVLFCALVSTACFWLLFVIIFILTLIQMKLQNKWVHYES